MPLAPKAAPSPEVRRCHRHAAANRHTQNRIDQESTLADRRTNDMAPGLEKKTA